MSDFGPNFLLNSNYRSRLQTLSAVSLLLLLVGCAPGELARQEGLTLLSDAKYEEGLGKLAEAVQQGPGNAQLRKDYLSQRGLIINRLLTDAIEQRRANHADAARSLYRRVAGLDPNNDAARQGLQELDAVERQPQRLGQCGDHQRLGQPRHAHQQAMAAREHSRHQIVDHFRLADDDLVDFMQQRFAGRLEAFDRRNFLGGGVHDRSRSRGRWSVGWWGRV